MTSTFFQQQHPCNIQHKTIYSMIKLSKPAFQNWKSRRLLDSSTAAQRVPANQQRNSKTQCAKQSEQKSYSMCGKDMALSSACILVASSRTHLSANKHIFRNSLIINITIEMNHPNHCTVQVSILWENNDQESSSEVTATTNIPCRLLQTETLSSDLRDSRDRWYLRVKQDWFTLQIYSEIPIYSTVDDVINVTARELLSSMVEFPRDWPWGERENVPRLSFECLSVS